MIVDRCRRLPAWVFMAFLYLGRSATTIRMDKNEYVLSILFYCQKQLRAVDE